MQDLETKKTALDDDALIYAVGADRVDAKSTKEKWSELDAKGKFQFFKDYYLLKTVIIVAVVVLLGSIIWAAVKPKPTPISTVLILDSVLDHTAITEFYEGMVTDQNLDTSKYTYDVYDDYTSTGSSDVTAVSTLLYAGTIQIVIATPNVIDRYAQNDILVDLADMPADIKAALSEDAFHYSTVSETDDFGNVIEGGKQTEVLSGISLNNTAFMKVADSSEYGTNYIFAIIRNDKVDVCYDTLRGMLGLPMASSFVPKK